MLKLSSLSPPQRVAADFLAGLGAAVVIVIVASHLGAPALTELLVNALAFAQRAWSASVRLAADNFGLLAAAQGVLWTLSITRRGARGTEFNPTLADAVGLGCLCGTALLYFAQLERISPAGASGVQVAATYAGLSAAMFPYLVQVRAVSREESGIMPVMLGVSVLMLILTGSLAGTTSPVTHDGEPGETFTRNTDAVLAHIAAVVASWLAAWRYARSAEPKCPKEDDASRAQEAAHGAAPVQAPAAAPLLLEENWEQRFARQKALRDAERRQRESGER